MSIVVPLMVKRCRRVNFLQRSGRKVCFSSSLFCAVILWMTLPAGSFSAPSNVQFLTSKADLRSIFIQWLPPEPSSNKTASSDFVVKYCEDYPWDDEPKHCRFVITNETEIQLKGLRPSTKYLVTVESLPNRAGRVVAGDTEKNHLSGFDVKLDRSKAVSVETQKYAIRNVECLKGRTNVTVETGDSFEGVISVQKKDGGPEKQCMTRGTGLKEQMYYLDINHTQCNVEFSDNGTIMNAVIMIQEHASLVLGSDTSFRISCNYQPAVIHIQTGMGMDSQHQTTNVGAVNMDPVVSSPVNGGKNSTGDFSNPLYNHPAGKLQFSVVSESRPHNIGTVPSTSPVLRAQDPQDDEPSSYDGFYGPLMTTSAPKRYAQDGVVKWTKEEPSRGDRPPPGNSGAYEVPHREFPPRIVSHRTDTLILPSRQNAVSSSAEDRSVQLPILLSNHSLMYKLKQMGIRSRRN